MSRTTKSPRKLLCAAYAAAQQALPAFSHRFSPQKFTLHQLFACLALKEFMRCDYRKLAALLEDAPELCAVIGLERVPHFTTFQKRAVFLLTDARAADLLAATLTLAKKSACSKNA